MRWSAVPPILRKPRASPRWLHGLVRGLRALVWAIGATYLFAGVLVVLSWLLFHVPGCETMVLDGPPPNACRRGAMVVDDLLRVLIWVFYPFWGLFRGG